ncbi:MAG: hypothetical protein ACKVI4_17925, partial [Actinomycetales bacterium]
RAQHACLLWRLKYVFHNLEWDTVVAPDLVAGFEEGFRAKFSLLDVPLAPKHVEDDVMGIQEKWAMNGRAPSEQVANSRLQAWMAKATTWTPPKAGAPPCHPVLANDPRAAQLSSRKQLVDALHRLLRSPMQQTIKGIDIGKKLAALAVAPERPSTMMKSLGPGAREDEEEAALRALSAPPPPKEKAKADPSKPSTEKKQKKESGHKRKRGGSQFIDDEAGEKGGNEEDSEEDESEDGFVVSDHESDADDASARSARSARTARAPSRTTRSRDRAAARRSTRRTRRTS